MNTIKITKMQGCGNDFVIIDYSEFEKTNIFIPLKNTQNKIVEFLDNINNNIKQKNDYIYNLILLKRALLDRKENIANA